MLGTVCLCADCDAQIRSQLRLHIFCAFAGDITNIACNNPPTSCPHSIIDTLQIAVLNCRENCCTSVATCAVIRDCDMTPTNAVLFSLPFDFCLVDQSLERNIMNTVMDLHRRLRYSDYRRRRGKKVHNLSLFFFVRFQDKESLPSDAQNASCA